MIPHLRSILVGLAICGALAACSGAGDVASSDDSGVDAAAADASAPDASDASVDSGAKDSALDAASSEAAADSGVADTSVDVAADGAVDAGPVGVSCSGTGGTGLTCGPSEVCCYNVNFGGDGICKSNTTSCASGSARITCTGTADCGSGKICCANQLTGNGYLLGTVCETTCTPIGSQYSASPVCSWRMPVAGECPVGKTCTATGPPFGWCL